MQGRSSDIFSPVCQCLGTSDVSNIWQVQPQGLMQ